MPTNSSEAELRISYKAIIRVKQYRLLLTSLGVPTSAKCYEDNESVVHTMTSHRITPRLRHVDIPTCFLHHEHGNKTFEVKQIPSRIQFANMGKKPESGPSLIRSSSIAMCHVHINDLSTEHYDTLCSIAPISCYKHFQRK